jgi:tetratricopeptide (TPR) repeat protein
VIRRVVVILGIVAGSLVAQEEAVTAAMRLAAQGKLREAEAVLTSASQQFPRDADVRYRLGLILLKQRKTDEAVQQLQVAVSVDDSNVFTWLALGDARLQQGKRAEAVDAAARAKLLAGSSAPAWKALSVLQGGLGNKVDQVLSLEKVVKLIPEDRDGYIRLANVRLDIHDCAGAGKAADAGLQGYPRDPELLRLRGLAMYGLGLKAEALDSFLSAMDAAPANELVHSSIESLVADAGDRLPEVRVRLQRFQQARPDSPLGPYLLAIVSPSDVDQFRLLKGSIEIDSGFWPAWFQLHKWYLEHDNRPEALTALETTIRLNPLHEAAHFALAEMYAQSGDREKALKHRQEHNRIRSGSAKH